MNENLNEKVSVNVNSATLSQIDLLIDKGYFSNRSDFINQALRESLLNYTSVFEQASYENRRGKDFSPTWFLGVTNLDNRTLLEAKAQNRTFPITGYGVLTLDQDIDEELLFSVVERIKVHGKVLCSPSVKAHYGLK